MNDIVEQLKSLGFSETEAKLYAMGSGYEPLTAAELGRLAGVKRPSVYRALESLMQRGLASVRGTGEGRKFSMGRPEKLKEIVQKEQEVLKDRERLVGDVIAMLAVRSVSEKRDSVKVEQYSGVEGVKAVIETALYCRSRKWDIIAPHKNFFSDFDKAYAQYYLETRKRHRIVARSLWEERSGRGLTNEEIRWRNPRLLSEALHGKFQSVLILFDDKVAIVSSLRNSSAILITSKEIHSMFSVLFEGLWMTSQEYIKHIE